MVRIGVMKRLTKVGGVKDAVAIGGSVTVNSGGRATGNAVAIGGDVREANSRVEGDAVSIAGEILKRRG